MKKSRYGLGRWLGAGVWPVKRVREMLTGLLIVADICLLNKNEKGQTFVGTPTKM